MATIPYEPTNERLEAMESTVDVLVTDDDYITFMPVSAQHIGLIFYPEAKVSPEAYSPLMLELANLV